MRPKKSNFAPDFDYYRYTAERVALLTGIRAEHVRKLIDQAQDKARFFLSQMSLGWEPVYTIDQLEASIAAFRSSLSESANESHLRITGYPTLKFGGFNWINGMLSNLYPCKAPCWTGNKQVADDRETVAYAWPKEIVGYPVYLEGRWSTLKAPKGLMSQVTTADTFTTESYATTADTRSQVPHVVAYSEAAPLVGLSREDAVHLDEIRGVLFDKRTALVDGLLWSLSRRNPEQITDTLIQALQVRQQNDIEKLLNYEHAIIVDGHKSSGGLLSWIDVAAHIDTELRTRHFEKTLLWLRENLVKLDPTQLNNFAEGWQYRQSEYYSAVGDFRSRVMLAPELTRAGPTETPKWLTQKDGFRTVLTANKEYSLTRSQADLIRILSLHEIGMISSTKFPVMHEVDALGGRKYRAFDQAGGLHVRAIYACAGLSWQGKMVRFDDKFQNRDDQAKRKPHPVWTDLIRRTGAGYYRLRNPQMR